MPHRLLALLSALFALTISLPAHAGFWGDAYDYWASGEMGEDMLNTVGLSGEDVVYAIDHPDEVWEAVKEDVSSGDAGERILNSVGLTPEDVAYVIDNPGEVADAVYQDWSSGEMGERMLSTVGLTGEDLLYIIDNPGDLGQGMLDEITSGRAGDRLGQFGVGLYEGGKEVVTETVYMVADGVATIYIVSAYEDYQGIITAYEPNSMLVQAYKNSDDPGETTRELLSGFAQLPGEFRDAMWNDPQKAGHIVGSFAVPLATPKGLSLANKALSKTPGLRVLTTDLRQLTPCALGKCPVFKDVAAVVESAPKPVKVTPKPSATRPRNKKPPPVDGPDPVMVEKVGKPSGTFTQRTTEMPYKKPPEMRTVNPKKPMKISDLDKKTDYLWVVDENGNVRIATEHQALSGYAPHRPTPGIVKHGDLTPGPDGATRGIARAGGELKFNPETNQWTMNNASSYSFNRHDQVLGNLENLKAVRKLLEDGGVPPGSIELKNVITPRPPGG